MKVESNLTRYLWELNYASLNHAILVFSFFSRYGSSAARRYDKWNFFNWSFFGSNLRGWRFRLRSTPTSSSWNLAAHEHLVLCSSRLLQGISCCCWCNVKRKLAAFLGLPSYSSSRAFTSCVKATKAFSLATKSVAAFSTFCYIRYTISRAWSRDSMTLIKAAAFWTDPISRSSL